MAVVQISKIQIRRGKANSGTGFPQLASGEMGWAVDTQELYIGNGSVAEGAPSVGNTKILTQNDFTAQGSILNLIQYIYKSNDPTIQTGPTVNTPVTRYIQDRLSDAVTTNDFGTVANGTTDDTAALQRAIDQSFLNSATKASDDTSAGASARVVLKMTPGIYKITSTIYIPSYATIEGAGPDKTIIQFTGTGPVIQFVNDTSTIGNPNVGSTLYINQPRGIRLSGLTVFTDTVDQPALQLDSVRDSIFENLIVKGSWDTTYTEGSKGIVLTATGLDVTSENNKFTNITVTGFNFGIFSRYDIRNNIFEKCFIETAYQGFALGVGSDGTVGQQLGPRETHINNCKFIGIQRHAVIVEKGTSNTTRDCTLTNVGNETIGNLPSHSTAAWPQIYFNQPGNSSQNDLSDRTSGLARDNLTTPYVPEISGHSVSYTVYGTPQISMGQITSPTLVFRLPVSTQSDGYPEGSITYIIDYVYRSSKTYSRRGTLTVVADINASLPVSEGGVAAPITQLTDEYDYAGNGSETDQLQLDFTVRLLDEVGDTYVGDPGQIPFTIGIFYTNNLSSDSGYLSYSYTAIL